MIHILIQKNKLTIISLKEYDSVRNTLLTLATQLKRVESLLKPVKIKNLYTKLLLRVEKEPIKEVQHDISHIIPLDKDSVGETPVLRIG